MNILEDVRFFFDEDDNPVIIGDQHYLNIGDEEWKTHNFNIKHQLSNND